MNKPILKPFYRIAPFIADESLICVLTNYEEGNLPVHIVHPEDRRVTAEVGASAQLAVERPKSNLLINRI